MKTARGATTGTEYALAPDTELGRGGEGVAYRVGAAAVKVFHVPPSRDESDKWLTLARQWTACACSRRRGSCSAT